ncbi:hypothetical protein M8J77_006969 [Diaphorina citri]|nr:hypothetical protein M8J77_006969 [Diaphorina citri]
MYRSWVVHPDAKALQPRQIFQFSALVHSAKLGLSAIRYCKKSIIIYPNLQFLLESWSMKYTLLNLKCLGAESVHLDFPLK